MAAGIAASSATASARKGAGRSIDIKDPESLDAFIQHLKFELESLAKKRKLWSNLTEEEQVSVLKRFGNTIRLEKEAVAVSTSSYPGTYIDAVTGTWQGQDLYTFTHNIEWEYDLNEVIFGSPVSAVSGTAPAIDIAYDGPGARSLTYGPNDSYFDYYREGKFRDVILPVTYTAILELRGEDDGGGATIQAEDGYFWPG